MDQNFQRSSSHFTKKKENNNFLYGDASIKKIKIKSKNHNHNHGRCLGSTTTTNINQSTEE
ncbi:hypothetical protein DERP_005078 [Dermatophagoides pteronyssinus]|uniref:Uncharacterized protein n=1 Tax=Dermatophagoides pteronyssinus TaxID=6956 RepID=A0ABQ8JTA3_DERPT|nr:hypothetical protein DERP_005078 [Dermatophagoides pteronyssinus]